MTFLVLLLVCKGTLHAESRQLHERIIYEKIASKVSTIEPSYARKLAAEIYNASLRYGVPYAYIQSIYFIESTYRLDAVNSSSGDYGIGQVNTWHIKKKGLSKERLLTDLHYSVDQSVKIMAWFYKTYRDNSPNDWVGRYNCGTKPSCTQWKSVKAYIKKVQNNL